MKAYFQVAIDQHIERAAKLLEAIDNSDVPREYHALATTCRTEIVSSKQQLEDLRDNVEMQRSELQTIRLRRFRRAVDRISKIEVTGIAALSRPLKDDIFLTRLVDLIRQEIKYPFLPPTVTTLSTNYFHIHNDIHLMFVPLSEGNYLLHLPDLYHELAHPLLFDDHNPRIADLRQSVDLTWAHALSYINDEIAYEERRRGPTEYLLYLALWQRSWRSWIVEFYCDLFAVFTLGPAFAWAHIHLCMELDHNPFAVPTRGVSSHPADDARMRVILLGLKKVGFVDVIDDLQARWDEYLEIADVRSHSNYRRCFPDQLLNQLVELAYSGMVKSPCRIVDPNVADPIHQVLNNAWYQFWHHPYNYIQWEKQAVEQLREMCGGFVKEASR